MILRISGAIFSFFSHTSSFFYNAKFLKSTLVIFFLLTMWVEFRNKFLEQQNYVRYQTIFGTLGTKNFPFFSHLELYWGSTKLFQVSDNFWHIGDKEIPIFFSFIWCYIEAAQNYLRYQTIFWQKSSLHIGRQCRHTFSSLLWLICSRTCTQNINYLPTYFYF